MSDPSQERWHTASQIFDGHVLHEEAAICIEGGVVTALKPVGDLEVGVDLAPHSGLITQGFFDIQVNGGGGVLLNTNPSVDGIRTICAAHRMLGTTDLFPTVISDLPEVTEAAADACLAARGVRGVRGIHIEGPHISQARRGTHKGDVLRPMDGATLSLVERLRAEAFGVLVTVAPEAVTVSQIALLVDMGAVVSVGHSDTTDQDAQACLKAGATCFTHLFNAMSPMSGRAPGVVGAAINSEVWCSIIADGIHVDPAMVALAFRARPKADRMIAISDAMPTVGGPDRFSLYGRELHLEAGRLVNDEGSLAGAHLCVLDAVRNLVSYGISLEDALRAGRSNPLELMGMAEETGLVGCHESDLLSLSSDLELQSVGLSEKTT